MAVCSTIKIEKGDYMRYIIAIDEGTTSIRAMLYDLKKKAFTDSLNKPIRQIYPEPAWVEQNASEIYANTLANLIELIELCPSPEEIAGIGITNQRETVVAWDRRSGHPVGNAIVWQCRRTSDFCTAIPPEIAREIAAKTGLKTDAYFSASKIKWILDHNVVAQRLLQEGNLCVGTIDAYLIFKLTEGRAFVTDYTNASRTMLFDIDRFCWDDSLLAYFGIPKEILPTPVSCTEVVGHFRYGGRDYPLAGVAGDQQAALFGQSCVVAGKGKITYGTGMFMLFSTGTVRAKSSVGMLSTIGFALGNEVHYALEGSVFNAGSAVQWLRDELRFFRHSRESEALALKVPDTGGVYVIPAFTGLGAPYWNSDARGLITGISRGTNKYHITRAVLESMAYAAKDLALLMERDSGVKLTELRCDGGASANDFLMQFQADVLNVAINRPKERESTALGATYLCAIALGLLDAEGIEQLRVVDRVFEPSADRKKFETLYNGYLKAIERCL